MSLEENEQRLLELVTQRRNEECRELHQRAEEEARELLRTAYGSARTQLHENAESERNRARTRIGAARAELETRRRQRAQQLGSVVLAAAWERLPQRLAQRWADPAARAAWIDSALVQALAALPSGPWRIRHPAGLADAERDALRKAVQQRLPQTPELVADAKLEAGLTFDCAGVMLDASSAGLVSDRDAIEARLLALLNLETAVDRYV